MQFVLTPDEACERALQAIAIETHYSERAGERRPCAVGGPAAAAPFLVPCRVLNPEAVFHAALRTRMPA